MKIVLIEQTIQQLTEEQSEVVGLLLNIILKNCTSMNKLSTIHETYVILVVNFNFARFLR